MRLLSFFTTLKRIMSKLVMIPISTKPYAIIQLLYNLYGNVLCEKICV